MRLGIRYRLLIPLALLLTGVIAASLWSARVAASRAEERVAGQVQNVSQTLSTGTFPLTPSVLDQMKSLSGAEFLLIAPAAGRFSTFPAGQLILPDDEAFKSGGATGIGPRVEIAGAAYHCRRVRLRDPHPEAGGAVYIFYPESLLNEAIADAQRPSLFGLAFGLGAVLLTFGIGQRLVSRIRALEKRTRQIAAGDFSPMRLPRQDDELRDLIASVNDMARTLADLRESARATERLRLTGQLAAGLAHQLRNGVTGARLAVQVYLDDRPAGDIEALQVTLRQLAVMDANLRRFIDLGRPGDGKREEVALACVLNEAIELLRPRCRHAGIDLDRSTIPEGAIVSGDAGQLGDLFGNILENAVEAAGPGGTVAIDVRREPKKVIVEIADTGPGPPPGIADRLFEPFVTGKSEGIGLGLAVARHAVEAHRGLIEWRREGGRTVFRVELKAD